VSAPTPVVRAAVYARDERHCLMCSTTDSIEWNHRAATGMGGSKRRPGAVEGVVLCGICNTAIESNATLMVRALAHGLKVRKWANPELVPVYVAHKFQWFRLEGVKRVPIPGVVAIDMMHAVYGDQYLDWFREANL
jgi:hypothetical protein